ncbi:Syntaxin-binding protein 5-like [Nymphon striatum]|nr:Syntaxin-binding protein 5-like [Nymphon striatum]
MTLEIQSLPDALDKVEVLNCLRKHRNYSACLFCYVANGNISAYSLPRLKLLLDQDFLPLTDLRIARTICFSNFSQGLYLCSPSELQKFTVSSDHVCNLQEMLGQLFLTKDMPEAPKQGFFKGLFGGGPSPLDKEELFGESSGKPSRSVAKHIPGNLDHIRAQQGSLAGELSRTRMALQERGEALGQLEDKSARMMSEAENFSNMSHQLMLKYRDKKWYQL